MLSASEELAQALLCLYSVQPTKRYQDCTAVIMAKFVFKCFSFPRVSTFGSDMQFDDCCLMICCVSDDVQ